MLRLRALAFALLSGFVPVSAYAEQPLTVPAFPGTTTPIQPPAASAPVNPGQPAAAAPMANPAPMPGAPVGAPTFAEPLPIGPTNPGYGAGMCPPPLPPYAWPTYAPYNNLSRVAYPTAYPYEAFPFIGPYYPFPKVPPGWRSVKLEWDDGYWWFSKTANKHNWWKVRFW